MLKGSQGQRRSARGNRAKGRSGKAGLMPHPSATVAREILGIAQQDGRPITLLELIKLTYLAHGWSLALRDEPLVSEAAEAWQYGPVFPDLYHALKSSRANPVSYVPSPTDGFGGAPVRVSAEEASLLRSVYNAYKGLNGVQLSSLTHQPNTPWDKAWRAGRNSAIQNEVIKAHFIELRDRQRQSA